MGSKISKEEIEEMSKLHEEGISLSEIARRLGVEYNRVYSYFKKGSGLSTPTQIIVNDKAMSALETAIYSTSGENLIQYAIRTGVPSEYTMRLWQRNERNFSHRYLIEIAGDLELVPVGFFDNDAILFPQRSFENARAYPRTVISQKLEDIGMSSEQIKNFFNKYPLGGGRVNVYSLEMVASELSLDTAYFIKPDSEKLKKLVPSNLPSKKDSAIRNYDNCFNVLGAEVERLLSRIESDKSSVRIDELTILKSTRSAYSKLGSLVQSIDKTLEKLKDSIL